MERVLLSLAACLFLCACSSLNHTQATAPDYNDKSISLPASGPELKDKFKTSLDSKSWKYTEEASSDDSIISMKRIKGMLSKPRYKMSIQSRFDHKYMFVGSDIYDVNISVQDTKNGTVVLLIAGQGSISEISEKFDKWLAKR